MAAPFANVGKLIHHFRAQVPGNDDYVIGPGLFQRRLGNNRDATSGHELALLGRIAIHHIRNQVLAHSRVIEQGVALGGGTVADHGFPGPLGVDQKREEIVFDLVCVLLETRVISSPVHSGRRFSVDQFCHPAARGMASGVFPLREQAQAAAMRRQFLDVKNRQPGIAEDIGHCRKGKIGKMLVVNRVELILLDQFHEMRELEGRHTLRLQQGSKARREIVDIRHVGQYIVGGHQIRLLALARKPVGQADAKKLFDGLDPLETRCGGCAGGWLDTQAGNASLLYILQQIAVIRCHLDHMAVGRQAETINHPAYILFRMLQPYVGKGTEVGILVIEQLRGP